MSLTFNFNLVDTLTLTYLTGTGHDFTDGAVSEGRVVVPDIVRRDKVPLGSLPECLGHWMEMRQVLKERGHWALRVTW